MKKGFIIAIIISVISLIIAIWFVMNTQGNIPTHWNMYGEIDGYGSPFTLLIFPLISLFVPFILYFAPKIDPKGDNIRKSGPILPILMVLISALMLGIEVIIIMAVNGSDILNLNIFISIIISIMFIVIGYYLPTIEPNYMLGIRTPWTLYSEESWRKTHIASKNWFISIGIVFLICMLLKTPYNIIIPLIFMLVILVGIIIYSYIVFTKEKRRNNE